MVSRKKTPSRRKLPSPAPELPPGSTAESRVLILFEDMNAKFNLVIEGLSSLENRMDVRFDETDRKNAARFSALEAAVALNSADIRKNSEDIRKNSEDIRKNSEDIRKNSEDIGRNTAEISGIRGETVSLRQSVDRLTAAVEGHGERISSLERRVDRLESA